MFFRILTGLYLDNGLTEKLQ